jgi:HPt (histidine-containing phosphotransfer) domain-containing protein
MRDLAHAVMAAAGDGEEIGRLARRLKGSCQNLGASAMAEISATLEAGAGEPAALADELARLHEPTVAALRTL